MSEKSNIPDGFTIPSMFIAKRTDPSFNCVELVPGYEQIYNETRSKFDDLKSTYGCEEKEKDALCLKNINKKKWTNEMTKIFEELGINLSEHQYKNISLDMTEFDYVTFDDFEATIRHAVDVHNRIENARSLFPDVSEFREAIEEIYENCEMITHGKKATYIPQLAKEDGNLWGVGVCMIDGTSFTIGNADDHDFSMQSCSKPIIYAMALEEIGAMEYMKYVSVEPSGTRFNAFTLTEDENIPFNPFVNAGAIVTCSLIQQGQPIDTKFEKTQKFFSRMCGQKVGFNNSIYLSEKNSADRNRALAYFMKENGCFPKGTKIDDVLDFYFQICSLEVNVESLAGMAATFANGGICPKTGRRVLSSETVRDCLIMLFSCGMYDYSGNWAFHVGLPAKSGVSGCIMVVVPGLFGLCTFSPPLDCRGNSVRGIEFCKRLTRKFNFHIFTQVVGTDIGEKWYVTRKNKILGENRARNKEKAKSLVSQACDAAGDGDTETLEKLINQGLEINWGDYDLRTPLHLAIANGKRECVEFLVEKGADFNLCDRWGNSALDEAIREGHTEIEKYLRSLGAKSNKELEAIQQKAQDEENGSVQNPGQAMYFYKESRNSTSFFYCSVS